MSGASAFSAARKALGEPTAFPEPGAGLVPVSPGQWLTGVADSGALDAGTLFLDRCAAAAVACRENQVSTLFLRASRVSEAAPSLAESLRQLAWFSAPSEDAVASAIKELQQSAERAFVLVAECFSSRGLHASQRCEELSQLRDDHEARTAVVSERRLSDAELAISPWTMLLDLLGLPPDWTSSTGVTDAQTARGASPLSEGEIGALGGKLTDHLVPDRSPRLPGITQSVAALVLTERCVIAHRCAESMFALLAAAATPDPVPAAAAIADPRNNGGLNLTSHEEIVRHKRERDLARNEQDERAGALATARLYAATIEGPVKRMGLNVLQLQGKELPTQPTAGNVRDLLSAHAPQVGQDLASSIEPEWRNGVDHRDFHWDAFRHQLIVRTEVVSTELLADRQSAGLAAYQGAEAGISLACALVDGLNEAVRVAAPAGDDAVIVAHRMREALAARRIQGGVEVSGKHLTVATSRLDLHNVFNAMIDRIDDFARLEVLGVEFEDAPSLLMHVEDFECAASLALDHPEIEFGIFAFSPVLAGALVMHGVDPADAANRCAGAAAGYIEERFAAILAEPDQRLGAAVLDRAARDANRLVREIERSAAVRTSETASLRRALGQLLGATREYQRAEHGAASTISLALDALRAQREALGPASLPWFV